MERKVCMFVWNHFTNDARVLRECTALAENGYDVELIAIHDPKDKNLKMLEVRDGFKINRVKRYPRYLQLFSYIIRRIKEDVYLSIPIIALFAALYYISPILFILAVLLTFLLCIKKIKTLVIRGHIGLRMIYYGLKSNADIYHSNDLNTMPQGYICSKVFRKRKLIYDSHEVQSSRTGYGEFHRKMEKFFIKKADVMIMTTHTRANYVRDLYKIEKPKVIHNYPFYTGNNSIESKYDLHKMLNIPDKEPILLYQGGVQAGRGLEQIVDAIEMIHKGIVVFIGDGKLKASLINRVKEKGLESRTRFMNKVPVDELKYYTADAYLGFQVLNNVCFNHYSALSNKLFEYIMSEIPVIACDFPEIKRIVEEEKIGICVDSHNSKKIAEATNKLLNDIEFYKQCKENCKAAKEKYNWTKEKGEFINIYEELLSNKLVYYVDGQGIGG